MSTRVRYSKRDQQLAEDWQSIAETAAGRRIIADIMTWGNVYAPITANDGVSLALQVGENNLAKRVAFYLGFRPEHYADQSQRDTDTVNEMDRMLNSPPAGMH